MIKTKQLTNKLSIQFEGLTEHQGPINLTVKGVIPPWAAGTLFRTGPGVSSVPDTPRGEHLVSHWFDGFAHSHRFDLVFDGGDAKSCSVVYSSCRQSQEFIDHVKAKGWRTGICFGQRADPCVGIFSKMSIVFRPLASTSNNNNVMPMVGAAGFPAGDKKDKNLLVLTDSATVQKLDPDTLQPIGFASQATLHSSLKGQLSCAHAQRDPETGDWFNFNLEFARIPTYRIFKVDGKTGKTEILATIADKEVDPAYIHSLFLTENYVVLCIPSAKYAWAGMSILWRFSLLEAIKPFDTQAPCRWIVIDRRHGKGVVDRFNTPAGFFFHSTNSFEETVEVDGEKRVRLNLEHAAFKNLDVMQIFYYDNLLNRNGAASKLLAETETYQNSVPHLMRYTHTLPASGSPASSWAAAKEATLAFKITTPHAGDLPAINPAYATKKHRYVWGVATRGLSLFFDSIVKTDTETGDALIWSGGKGHTPSEMVFIARPGATDEDDGVVLSIVLDGNKGHSYVLCLDAKTLEELGRAEANFAIAFGLHGVHVPSKV